MADTRAPHISRGELAGALAEIARDDPTVARALAACEAWETGYVGLLLTRAEQLAANDAPDTGFSRRDRSFGAIDRAIRLENPFQRVERAGVHVTEESIVALLKFLDTQALFHDTAAELERRGLRRHSPATDL